MIFTKSCIFFHPFPYIFLLKKALYGILFLHYNEKETAKPCSPRKKARLHKISFYLQENIVITAAGIIAEYNPFHSGHQYQIEETRRLTGADFIVVVLSGNFVQRGEPAIFEKSQRARMALLGGADLVLELPAPFAVGSAEDFASGAVSLINQIGAIQYLSFGSECGSLYYLSQAARILIQEPPLFQNTLKEQLRLGLTYPQARSAALNACGLSQAALQAANEPNNLLGIEYLKAIGRQKSRLEPVTVQRKGKGYHDSQIPAPSERESQYTYASASGIRRELSSHTHLTIDSLKEQIPSALHPLYHSGELLPIYPDDLSAVLNYRILSCIQEGRSFQEFSDVSSELAGRLTEQAYAMQTFTNRITALKTRKYTYTRISRSLLHILLNIRREDMAFYRQNGCCSYARILGFRRSASPLLRSIKENSAIPLISKAADARSLLTEASWKLWSQDVFCSHFYHALVQAKYGILLPNEYSRPIVIF